MDFAIVHFQTENSVAVVPSIWVAGESNLCYWPPYRASRLETAVKEREKSTVDWECINNVRVLHFYDNYHKARLNLSKAEHDTSALESENEIFGNLKRKKIVSDISEDDDNLSDTNSSFLSAATPFLSSGTNKVPHESFLNDVGAIPSPAFPLQLQANKDINRKRKSTSTMATSSDFFKKTLNVPALVEKAACSSKTPGYKTISAEATVPNSALKLVLDKLATMQQEILHISQVQQNMFNAIQKMVAVKKRELPECVELPVKTLLELKSLEKNLDNKDSAQAVSNHLGMRGGKDVSDTTRRILEKVFSNDLAKKLNWAGRCNKTGVKDLKIVSCIKAAVQINKSFDANEVSIENVVKSWLKYAGDREGGRDAPDRVKRKELSIYQDNVMDNDDEGGDDN